MSSKDTEQNAPKDKDAFFDYILARSRARESSTLTLATVAASISLVLFALYIQADIEPEPNEQAAIFAKYKYWISCTGLLFALVGISYRAITAHTIHRWDQKLIEDYLKITDRTKAHHTIIGILREALVYLLLLIPIAVWIGILF